jgi:hypothetical protein
MSASVYVAHQTTSRTRLRVITSEKKDPHALSTVAELVETLQGVERAEPRPATGSIIIDHPELCTDELNAALVTLPLEWGPPPEPDARPALLPLIGGMNTTDSWLNDTSGGRVDLGTLIILAMLSLALTQALRGNIMAPATSLVWYALDLLLRRQGQPSV